MIRRIPHMTPNRLTGKVLPVQLFRLFSPISSATSFPPKMWTSHPHASVSAETTGALSESPYIISCVPKDTTKRLTMTHRARRTVS